VLAPSAARRCDAPPSTAARCAQTIEALKFSIGLGLECRQRRWRYEAGRTPLDAVLRPRETSEDTVTLLKRLSGVSLASDASAPAATTTAN
jgi:hypothetical protein